jgi:hypothetical protein
MGAMRPAAMDEKLTQWGRLIDFNLYTSRDADRR